MTYRGLVILKGKIMFRTIGAAAAMSVAALAFPSVANAATTVTVDSTNTSGWTIDPPGDDTAAAAAVKVINRPPTWDATAPWISTVADGNALLPPGNADYIFTLETPTWLRSLTGQYWADNRLVGVMVQNSLGWVDLPFTQNSSNEQFRALGLAGRTFNFTTELEQAGTISAVKFRVLNLTDSNNPAGSAFRALGTAVPEPGTWLLMILGLGAVGFAMRRRQSVTARLQFA
jgi:hypothetical protein